MLAERSVSYLIVLLDVRAMHYDHVTVLQLQSHGWVCVALAPATEFVDLFFPLLSTQTVACLIEGLACLIIETAADRRTVSFEDARFGEAGVMGSLHAETHHCVTAERHGGHRWPQTVFTVIMILCRLWSDAPKIKADGAR